jgi:hypothetical protein
VTCAEQWESFVHAARSRAADAGVEALVEFFAQDAQNFPLKEDHYDAATCLGASFVWGGLTETVAALTPTVHDDGFIAVGKPYWRVSPLPGEFTPEEGWLFLPLTETVERFEAAGIELVTLISSSQDDWDRYESLHWYALEEWLHDNPGDQDAGRFREMGRRYKRAYLRWHRDLLGWAILVGRKR